ncbi:hypothetical protein PTKIN_Ptkin01aG0060400 [Pterospermum kingtungense]
MARSDKVVKLLFLLFLLKVYSLQLATMSHSWVKFLPGFVGPLPFKLETGYVGVGESDDVQLFYYFVESESGPEEDPLLLWLTGGPGCSGISGFVYEIGPLNFNVVEYNGTLPTLVLNPYSWTKISNIIFVDSPVGTGFSYARNHLAAHTSDIKQAHQLHLFLQKWLMDHPEFMSSPVYIGGDSYSGITLPVLVQEILHGNEEGIRPLINLQGYILGNPRTVPSLEANSQIPFAHRMALISDELYESLKRSCAGEYQNINPNNVECQKDLQYYIKCTSRIETAHILEPLCSFASSKPQEMSARRRYLDELHKQLFDPEPPTLPTIGCRGSIGQWWRCDYGLPYTADLPSSFLYHVNLSTRGYRSLVYSGDHDMLVPYLATEAWIKTLNYSIVDDWRPWMLQGQVAGYTRTYANQMTYATIKGGGHTAPEYRPAECFAMFKRWISGEPL